MPYVLPDNRRIKSHQSFVIGSGEAAIQYPPHWLTKASPSDLAALGITWEADAPKVRPPKPLDDVKKELKDAISVQAENIRLQYVTAGSGKAMSYQEKLAEARLVLDDTAAAAALTAQEQQDTYPILASEIGVTAADLVGVASVVHATYMAFKDIEALINGKEMAGKAAVGAALDEESARAAFSAIDWTMPG